MTETLKRPLVLAALAVVLLAVAAVLYVNRTSVNADHPPTVLSALTPVAKPEAAPAVAFTDAAGKPHMMSEFKGNGRLRSEGVWKALSSLLAPCLPVLLYFPVGLFC